MRSVRGVIVGCQEPRLEWLPPGVAHPDTDAALDLAAAAGIRLDGWQERWFRGGTRVRDGKWAAFEVGSCVARQNGKNEVLIVRELAGALLFGESLIVHTAHLADTCREAFRRLEQTIQANEWLAREVKHVWRTNGFETIEFRNGSRIRFRTRTKSGGRGLTGDCVIFDEAMIFAEASHGSVLPLVSAKSIIGNPQVWYTGSAVDKLVHEDGLVFTRLRERGLTGDDADMCWFEWSADCDDPEMFEFSEEAVAQANPALGIRISLDHVLKEQRSMDPRTFAVERAGVGDWPDTGADGSVISVARWNELVDRQSAIKSQLAFCFDVSPNRGSASISAAGLRQDGLAHVEVIEKRAGTGWVVGRMVELVERHKPVAVVFDDGGAAKSLIHELEQKKVEVTGVTAGEHAEGCGMFFDAVDQGTLRHLGDGRLASAIRGAVQRRLGDRWAWSRRSSSIDITPLVSCTLALWATLSRVRVAARVVSLNDITDD